MSYQEAKRKYEALGVDVEKAMEKLKTMGTSMGLEDFLE